MKIKLTNDNNLKLGTVSLVKTKLQNLLNKDKKKGTSLQKHCRKIDFSFYIKIAFFHQEIEKMTKQSFCYQYQKMNA